MELVERFITKLKDNFSIEDKLEFERITGASEKDIKTLINIYNTCPESLINLLKIVNGTHGKYDGKIVLVYMFNSDVGDGEYPYYLESIEQIIKERISSKSIIEIYGKDCIENYNMVSKEININIGMNKRLCFSQCMNNGGTSRLYIDFNPTEFGVKGQIIRYIHDPDEYKVIANSFDEYLDNVIDSNFIFLNLDY